MLVAVVRGERQEEEKPQDGEEEQSGDAGEQILLQGCIQNALVRQRCPEAHDGVLEQTAERGGEDKSSSWLIHLSVRTTISLFFH